MPRTKGYFTEKGYMGWVEWKHKFMLFACEKDYLEYVIDIEQN